MTNRDRGRVANPDHTQIDDEDQLSQGQADHLSTGAGVLRCRVNGHRFRFAADGDTMTWRCARDCGAGGSKRYATAADAARYAAAFDREDQADLGRRAPLVGLLPLRLARVFRRRHASGPDTPPPTR